MNGFLFIETELNGMLHQGLKTSQTGISAQLEIEFG